MLYKKNKLKIKTDFISEDSKQLKNAINKLHVNSPNSKLPKSKTINNQIRLKLAQKGITLDSILDEYINLSNKATKQPTVTEKLKVLERLEILTGMSEEIKIAKQDQESNPVKQLTGNDLIDFLADMTARTQFYLEEIRKRNQREAVTIEGQTVPQDDTPQG